MYIILVYDVGEERVAKVCKYLRRYLPRIQNSVFEGELSDSKLTTMKSGLEKIIITGRDSVLLWVMRSDHYVDRQILGVEKLPIDTIF